MKTTFAVFRSKGFKIAAALAVAFTASSAHAALPDWATGIVTSASSAVTDVATAVGPVIALSVGAVLVIKLIKRFANKI